MSSSSSKHSKVLAVFDFDSTLVEASCDHYILNVITETLSEPSNGWSYPATTMWDMPPIYRALQERGICATDLLKCLDEIHYVHGMQDLLLELARRGHEVIIISDCNSVFIGHTLKKAGLQDCIADIFTNPAWFDEKGRLRLSEYHHQDWCELCPPNLCKGHVLQNYLRKRYTEGEEYLFVAYIGDGQNDYCPSLCLDTHDLVLPRIDFDLYRTINNESASTNGKRRLFIRAKVVPWETGFNVKRAILDEIRRYK